MRYRLLTETIKRLSARHQTVLATFLRFRKPLYSCTEGMCHSSIRPGTSYHMTQFYQVLQATNAGARRPGYEASVIVCCIVEGERVANWNECVIIFRESKPSHFSCMNFAFFSFSPSGQGALTQLYSGNIKKAYLCVLQRGH